MNESVPPLSVIEYDQNDIVARLQNDPYFATIIPVLEQRRGITENDVQIAMSVLQPGFSQVGSVAIVLMPDISNDAPNAPGPSYVVRYGVQVIDWPIVRRQSPGGTQVSAEEIADRVREILHYFNFGRGQTLYFDTVSPIQVQEGQVSYIIRFRKKGQDQPPTSVASVAIAPNTGSGTQTVTLTCGTPSTSIYYTVDGSYPGSAFVAPNGTAILYSAPFVPGAGATLRTAAELTTPSTSYQQSIALNQAQFS